MLQTREEPCLGFFISSCRHSVPRIFLPWKLFFTPLPDLAVSLTQPSSSAFLWGGAEMQDMSKQCARNELLWIGTASSASQHHCFSSHPSEHSHQAAGLWCGKVLSQEHLDSVSLKSEVENKQLWRGRSRGYCAQPCCCHHLLLNYFLTCHSNEFWRPGRHMQDQPHKKASGSCWSNSTTMAVLAADKSCLLRLRSLPCR